MSEHDRTTGPGERQTSTWQALTHGRTLFTLLMLSIFVVMVGIAATYTWPANLLPLVIGIPGILLTLFQVVQDVRSFHATGGEIDPRTEFERYMDEISKHTTRQLDLEIAHEKLDTLVEDRSTALTSRAQREIVLFGFFFLLLGLVLTLGFWIAVAIFLLLFLRLYAKESWKVTLSLTAGGWIALYLVLAVLLDQILFEGFLTIYITDTWFSE